MKLFFELMRIVVGEQKQFCVAPTQKEWGMIFSIVQKQALIGVTSVVLKTLPPEQRPKGDLALVWYAMADKLKLLNAHLNGQCVEISQWFREQGFSCCILKGQGNAQMYDFPELRNPGDIDAWLWPMDRVDSKDLAHRRRCVIDFVRNTCGNQEVVYHHIDFPHFAPTEVEIHFTPTWLNDYFKNRRLQHFFEEEAGRSFQNFCHLPGSGDVAVPTWKLNVVFQLIHIQKHLFAEGIGLRQMMDYYYLLRQGDEDGRREMRLLIEQLGLRRFAEALMWVLYALLGLEEEWLLFAPDERGGRFLMEEILAGGNFGHYSRKSHGKWDQRLLGRAYFRLSRGLRFLRMNYSEVLWMPAFKTWHYFWRKRKGYWGGASFGG